MWRVTSTMNLNVMIGTWWYYITLDLIILDTLMVRAACLFSQSLMKWIQFFNTLSMHFINRCLWLICFSVYLYLESLLFWLLLHSADKHLYQLCQPWLTTVIMITWFITFSSADWNNNYNQSVHLCVCVLTRWPVKLSVCASVCLCVNQGGQSSCLSVRLCVNQGGQSSCLSVRLCVCVLTRVA